MLYIRVPVWSLYDKDKRTLSIWGVDDISYSYHSLLPEISFQFPSRNHKR